jgi:hypothetical protein
MGKAQDKSIYELIGEYVRNFPEISDNNSAIADKIITDGMGGTLSHRTLRLRVAEWKDEKWNRSKASITETKEGEKKRQKNENPYHIENEENDPVYVIESRFGTVRMPVSKVDKMFFQYSKHGENLSSEEMIAAYELKVWEWHALKNALRLYKASNIYSPHTVENTPEEEVSELVSDKMKHLFKSKKLAIREYNKELHSEYKQAVKKENWKELELIAFKDSILEDVDMFREKVTLKFTETNNGKECTIAIADLHLGADYEGGTRTPEFSPAILVDRLRMVARKVNQLGFAKVHIMILGDIIESFTGLNHPNSFRGIRKGMLMAQVVKSGVHILRDFLQQINDLGDVYIVPGNHDRVTSNNKEDTRGEAAYIICDWLSDIMSGVCITNVGAVGSFRVGNINNVMEHGHLGLSKQKSVSKAWKYGIQGMFNVIWKAHLHSLIIDKDDWNMDVIQLTVPSIFSGNEYSDHGGWDGTSGFTLMTEDVETGKPDFRIIPLK